MGLGILLQASPAFLIAFFAPPAVDKFDSYLSSLEAITPLLAALMGAHIFAADNEPPIELLLTYPRPLWQIVLERTVCMTIMLLFSSVTSAVIFLVVTGEPVLRIAEMVLALVPSSLFMGALALAMTLRTARGTAGLLVTLLVGLVLTFATQSLFSVLPALRWISLLTIANETVGSDWLINRLALSFLGLLACVSALRDAQRSEHFLGS